MALYSRSGRPRPAGGGSELAIWYLMRLTGLALFVLAIAHYLILHFVFDPAEQTTEFITNERWNSLFWRAFDWLLLQMVVFHSFAGLRTILGDYMKGGARTFVMSGLYLLAIVLFVLGTIVVMTLPVPGTR
jgi:succinate dehydrogenase / fumarate reductase membrane anchor subunit